MDWYCGRERKRENRAGFVKGNAEEKGIIFEVRRFGSVLWGLVRTPKDVIQQNVVVNRSKFLSSRGVCVRKRRKRLLCSSFLQSQRAIYSVSLHTVNVAVQDISPPKNTCLTRISRELWAFPVVVIL